MLWSRTWQIVGSLLCAWVLAANVYVDFRPVRARILIAPLPARQTVSLSLAAAADIPQPYVVLVYRIRNLGTASATISAQIDGRVLHQQSVAPGSSARVDLSWRRPASVPADYRVDLASATTQWTVEYAEVANLHGFTRGGVEFLILPAQQPFVAPSPLVLLTLAAWALLLGGRQPAQWPRGPRAVHLALSMAFVALFVAAALSPLLSAFRVALSPHTFLLGILVLSAPHTLDLLQGCRRSATRALVACARELLEGCHRSVALVLAGARWLAPAVRLIAAIPWFRVALATGLAAYALLLWLNVGAQAGGADSSGYLNGARILASGRVSTSIRALPGFPPGTVPQNLYTPLGLRPSGADALVPFYPLGLPLTIVTISHVMGWELAAGSTMVLYALFGVTLVFWLARECGLSAPVAALGALLLATSPLYLFLSLTVMSDAPALVWTTAAVLLAWRSRRDPRWAVLAGAALALAVLTRPTNILAMAPVAVCLGASPRRWLLLTAGGGPGAALLAYFNLAAYGSAITTGYGDMSALFGPQNVPAALWHYARWLPVLLTPIGLLALGLPTIWRRAPRLVTVFLVWIAVFMCPYAFYFNTHETWWYLRFILPAFPPLIVGSLWVGRLLMERWDPTRRLPSLSGSARAGTVLLALMILGHNAWWGRTLSVLSAGPGERVYREAAEWTRTHLPPDAAIVAMQVSGAFFYYTDYPVLRWDYFDTESVQRVEAEAAAGRVHLYAVLFPFEINGWRAFARLPGTWAQVGAIKQVTVWRFTGAAGELARNARP